MARRSNELSVEELTEINRKEKSYVSDWNEAVRIFLKDCELRNLREHTVRYYRNELNTVQKHLQEQNVSGDPSSMTEEHIKRYIIGYMRREGLKISSINSRLRAVRAMFNFLYSQNYIGSNPVKGLKLLKDRRQIIATFSRQQVKQLLSQPNLRTFTGIRDYTMMLLLLETGIRANEFVSLNLTDVKIEESVIHVRNAKGNQERIVPITSIMKKQLKKYSSIRGYVETDALFITLDNNRLSKRQLQNIISKYGKAAGIKDVRCSPHTFRHTFARMAVENGAGTFELQAILGHSSLEIVKVYVNLFSDDVKAKHKTFSPLKGIDIR